MKKIFTLLAALLSAFTLNAAEFKDVTDASGDVVKVPAKVEKIATLWYANNQIILMLGGADKIVATTDLIKNNKWFAHIYPRISSIPNGVNGKDLQVEELIKLSPDVVIAARRANQKRLYRTLSVIYQSCGYEKERIYNGRGHRRRRTEDCSEI